jgi:hypothetical protein
MKRALLGAVLAAFLLVVASGQAKPVGPDHFDPAHYCASGLAVAGLEHGNGTMEPYNRTIC